MKWLINNWAEILSFLIVAVVLVLFCNIIASVNIYVAVVIMFVLLLLWLSDTDDEDINDNPYITKQ